MRTGTSEITALGVTLYCQMTLRPHHSDVAFKLIPTGALLLDSCAVYPRGGEFGHRGSQLNVKDAATPFRVRASRQGID